MAETFGEADVILRVRLDRLQQELDEAERQIRASDERVARSQERVVAQVQAAGEQTGRTMGDAAVEVTQLLLIKQAIERRWQAINGLMRRALGLVTRIGRAIVTIPAALLALPFVLGDIIRAVRGIPDLITNISEAIRNLTVADVGQFLMQIPLIGAAFRGVARTINEISNLLGGPDFLGAIEESEEAVRRAEIRVEAFREAARLAGDALRGVRDELRALEQQAERIGLEGMELVSVEARQDAENQIDAIGRRIREVQRRFSERTRELWEEAGVTSRDQLDEETALRLEVIAREGERRLRALHEERDRAVQLAREIADARIREEERRQREADRLERERVQDARQRLEGGTRALELEAAGEQIEAARVRVEESRRRMLRQIEQDGNDETLGLTEDFYDARQRLIDRREREQIERDRQLQERREQTVQDTRQRLMSQIRQAQLEADGRELEARQEQIRQRFQSMIDQFQREGDEVSADLARRLGRLQLEAAERDRRASEVARQQQFRQVALSRIAIDGMSGDDRVERDQLTELKRIRQNTRPAHRAAVAG